MQKKDRTQGRPAHLLIIDPSIAFPEERGAQEIIRGWTGRVTVRRPALDPESALKPSERLPDVDGVVIMGSRASVNDDLPWLRDLAAWLAGDLASATPHPLLGICFGHQLIAKVTGGRVGHVFDDRHAVRGVVETALSGGRLVPGDHTLAVVASHTEAVHEVPPGFDVTARRPLSPHDGLEHRELPLFSVQFHPEAGEDFLSRRGIDPASVDRRFLEDGPRVLAAFRRFVLSRHAQRD